MALTSNEHSSLVFSGRGWGVVSQTCRRHWTKWRPNKWSWRLEIDKHLSFVSRIISLSPRCGTLSYNESMLIQLNIKMICPHRQSVLSLLFSGSVLGRDQTSCHLVSLSCERSSLRSSQSPQCWHWTNVSWTQKMKTMKRSCCRTWILLFVYFGIFTNWIFLELFWYWDSSLKHLI